MWLPQATDKTETDTTGMKKHCIAMLALLIAATTNLAAQAVYAPEDSILIEKLLQKHRRGTGTLPVAVEFTGVPYVAGTLEDGEHEALTVNTRQTDCTTFVETVVAIVLTANEGHGDFKSFCRNLERIRYRGGVCRGYASRLHYISQWVADSAKRHVAREIITPHHTATQLLRLDFMSRHPAAYKQLKKNPSLIKEIEKHESPFRNIKTRYIPKSRLNAPCNELGIMQGDILALVTGIEGLDVSHVGFALIRDNRLHMLHASSARGAVVADSLPLYDYMKGKKNHLGIRIIRIETSGTPPTTDEKQPEQCR